jgi:hypothetical protein
MEFHRQKGWGTSVGMGQLEGASNLPHTKNLVYIVLHNLNVQYMIENKVFYHKTPSPREG